MIKNLFLIGMVLSSFISNSQELDENTFDFWIGEWNVSWEDENGKIIKGVNNVERIMNGKVIQEDFRDSSFEYQGKSFSVFNSNKIEWNQYYVDSNGTSFSFIGAIEDGDPVFKTKELEKDGEKIILKMVFKDITENDFVWKWIATRNGGTDWKTLWKINYSRK